MEIIITLLIVLLSIFIIFKNILKSSKGDCNCSSCSSQCPKYKEKEDDELKLIKK